MVFLRSAFARRYSIVFLLGISYSGYVVGFSGSTFSNLSVRYILMSYSLRGSSAGSFVFGSINSSMSGDGFFNLNPI